MIRPLKGFVSAKKEIIENKTKSGLYVPKEAQATFNIAKIVAAGKASQVLIGDRVVYDRPSTVVNVDGEELLIIREEDIFAIIEEKNNV